MPGGPCDLCESAMCVSTLSYTRLAALRKIPQADRGSPLLRRRAERVRLRRNSGRAPKSALYRTLARIFRSLVSGGLSGCPLGRAEYRSLGWLTLAWEAGQVARSPLIHQPHSRNRWQDQESNFASNEQHKINGS